MSLNHVHRFAALHPRTCQSPFFDSRQITSLPSAQHPASTSPERQETAKPERSHHALSKMLPATQNRYFPSPAQTHFDGTNPPRDLSTLDLPFSLLHIPAIRATPWSFVPHHSFTISHSQFVIPLPP